MIDMFKTKVGVPSRKKSRHNISNHSSGSMTWGEVIPTYSFQLDKDDTLSHRPSQFVRLMPMVLPTFSRQVSCRNFAKFVPYNSVWEGYDNFLAKKNVTTSLRTYVPEQVPQCSLGYLFYFAVLFRSDIRSFEYQSTNDLQHGSRNYVGISETTADYNYYLCSRIQARYLGSDEQVTEFNELTKGRILYNDSRLTLESADYIVCQPNFKALSCFKFNGKSKRLLKILRGLGYQPDLDSGSNSTSKVSLLPLFAYYKAYFDTFFPQRFITWKQTACYKLLHYFYDSGTYDLQDPYTQVSVEHSKAFLARLFTDFLDELSECWYTYESDYFSNQIRELNLQTLDTEEVQLTSIYSTNGSSYSKQSAIADAQDAVPVAPIIRDNLTKFAIDAVSKLTRFINKNSVVGSRVNEYLKAHNLEGNFQEDDTLTLGRFVTNISVSDINATASSQTDSGYTPLGDFTGKGVGTGSSSKITFTAKSVGIYIMMSTIVPDLGYCQGVSPSLRCLTPFDFYHQEFDALGNITTPINELYTNSEFVGDTYDTDTSKAFGYVPRYSGLKVKTTNNVFGDLINKSTRDSMLPYVLDRFIPASQTTIVEYASGSKDFIVTQPDKANLVASAEWKYLGKYKWMSNFNRIFNNYREDIGKKSEYSDYNDTDAFDNDNFVIHQLNDVVMMSPKMPVSESFDTDGESGHIIKSDR
ncbi:major capsid protein [Capybara microvirus Cap1_SP_59]|nr:major capsid protein [Capybara microvirus Cap1_SP_59]